MKKLMTALILSLGLLLMAVSAAAAPANEPTDLTAMQEAGLSPENIGRFLSQNLSERTAPQMDGRLLVKLAQYGGDSLALAYLDLDKASAQQKHREFSPEVVEQLMAAGTPPAELNMILAEETARVSEKNKPQSTLMPPPLPPQTAQAPPSAPAAPQTASLAPPSAPKVAYPESPRLAEPARPRGFQDLRPGQAADPASRLPLPYSTYDIRQNRQDGDIRRINQPAGGWMGVTERELPDGHVVETNSIGHISQVGQEVYARPSGHQVYRYWTGNPDNTYSGADPRQEQKNREDLQIIFSRRDRR